MSAVSTKKYWEGWQRLDSAVVFFFFSSRRRHTRLQGDWSSDVCSSDLEIREQLEGAFVERRPHGATGNTFTLEPRNSNAIRAKLFEMASNDRRRKRTRSEERRVGKECRSRWSPYH